MQFVGEIGLLVALVASGYSAFACAVGRRDRHPALLRGGLVAAAVGLAALGACLAILAWALWQRDFAFDYVAKYSSRQLAARYSLSALWVGQAGSLLLWTWLTALTAATFRFLAQRAATRLVDVAFAVAMAFVAFLAAIMVFAADPMTPSLVVAEEGAGLSPLLQHPAMMVHPPIVFAGYAAWTIPFALALAALLTGQLDLAWVAAARPWAILAWLLLGVGILLGANWAYEELGWGGYWGWDPVENGSLMPWLTGTVFIHSLMLWRHRDGAKKSALALAVATFGLCNFATFLTRSGIFSSLHAFSESPIGWMFLVLMGGLFALAGGLLVARRRALASPLVLRSLWARETQIIVAGAALLLLTGVVLVGTVMLPASMYWLGTQAVVGPDFYNAVLAPTGLVLLATTVAVPLLRWGAAPRPTERKLLLTALAVGLLAALAAAVAGWRRPEALLVAMLVGAAPVTLLAGLVLDRRRSAARAGTGFWSWLAANRPSYAGYVVHLGFVALAAGVTGSSLGSQRLEIVMQPGDVQDWAGRQIRYRQPLEIALPDRVIAAVELEIADGGQSYTLRPARHYHLLQEQWTTEVAIHSSWGGDLYTILHGGQGGGAASLTLVDVPLVRWLWLGGAISGVGAAIALWPARRRQLASARPADPPAASPSSTAHEVRAAA